MSLWHLDVSWNCHGSQVSYVDDALQKNLCPLLGSADFRVPAIKITPDHFYNSTILSQCLKFKTQILQLQ